MTWEKTKTHAMNEKTEPAGNMFLTTLQRHRGGLTLDDLSAQLTALVSAVALAGKGGMLTLKIGVKPASRGKSAVVIQDKISLTLPKVEAEESFWFANEAGELMKEDPKQTRMPFAVEGGIRSSEPRSAAAV